MNELLYNCKRTLGYYYYYSKSVQNVNKLCLIYSPRNTDSIKDKWFKFWLLELLKVELIM